MPLASPSAPGPTLCTRRLNTSGRCGASSTPSPVIKNTRVWPISCTTTPRLPLREYLMAQAPLPPALLYRQQHDAGRLENGPARLQGDPGTLENGVGRRKHGSGRLKNGPARLQSDPGNLENRRGRRENGPGRLEKRLGWRGNYAKRTYVVSEAGKGPSEIGKWASETAKWTSWLETCIFPRFLGGRGPGTCIFPRFF